MSNKHQELASPEQTVSGKHFSNPLIVDSLLKTIWFINAPCFCNEALAIPGQTATVARVTSLETEPKKTKEVHGKALTKLVKKVKRLEDKLKSTNERKKAKIVISNEEEELVKEQSQETFKAELSVLGAAKILVETSKERVKTYNKRRRSTDSSQVSTAIGLFSNAEDIQDTNEELAKKVQEEEQTKVLEVLEQQEQERANLEAALNLQKLFDQERKAADDIAWSKIVEQAQLKSSG
ncbi:hypothetical protein Tco_1153725 [Tanacetum coccineum]